MLVALSAALLLLQGGAAAAADEGRKLRRRVPRHLLRAGPRPPAQRGQQAATVDKCAKALKSNNHRFGTPPKLNRLKSGFAADVLTLAIDTNAAYNVSHIDFEYAKRQGGAFTMDEQTRCKKRDDCIWRTERKGCTITYTVRMGWSDLWKDKKGGLSFIEVDGRFFYTGVIKMRATRVLHGGNREYSWQLSYQIGFPDRVELSSKLTSKLAAMKIVQKFIFFANTITPSNGRSPARVILGFETWVIKPWKMTNKTSSNRKGVMVTGGPSGMMMKNLQLYEPGGPTDAHCLQDTDKRYCRQKWELAFTVHNKDSRRLQCSINGNYRVRFGIYDHYNKNDADDINFRFSLKSPSLCPQVVGDINFYFKKLQGFRDPEFKIHVPVYTTWEIAYFQAKIDSKELVDAQLNSTHISKVFVQHKDKGLTQIYGDGKCLDFGCDVNVKLLRPKARDQAAFMVTLDPNFISSSALGVVSQVQVQVVLTYARKQRRLITIALPKGAERSDEAAGRHRLRGDFVVRSAAGIQASVPRVGHVSISTSALQRILLTTILVLVLGISYIALRLCLRKKQQH